MPMAIKAKTTINKDILSLRIVQIDEKVKVYIKAEVEVEVVLTLTLTFIISYFNLFTISLNALPRCS